MLTLVTAVIAFIALTTIYHCAATEVEQVLDGHGGDWVAKLLATPVAIGCFFGTALVYPLSASMRHEMRNVGYFKALGYIACEIWRALRK